jgi:Icc protein
MRGGLLALLITALAFAAVSADNSFRFVILGDRTGGAQPGVFKQVLREASAENPAFVLATGDLIEGLDDERAAAEWRDFERIMAAYTRFPFYVAPGNHDAWSARSEALFRKYTGRPLHYSFDYGGAHFTILDNSRSDEMPAGELAFLEEDLKAHRAQPVKFIVSHRPSWVLPVALRNADFPLHQIARRYGVQYVIAGHVHQMFRLQLDGVTYVSMPSAGGHLRASAEYDKGWFFGHGLVTVWGSEVDFRIEEARAPHGLARVTELADWGMLGLERPAKAAAGAK